MEIKKDYLVSTEFSGCPMGLVALKKKQKYQFTEFLPGFLDSGLKEDGRKKKERRNEEDEREKEGKRRRRKTEKDPRRNR